MIARHNIIRLKGKKLAAFNNKVYERDGGRCVVCHKYVPPGTKIHHEWSYLKSDVIEECATVCNECHYQRHHGKLLAWVRQRIREYLIKLYGKDRWHNE